MINKTLIFLSLTTIFIFVGCIEKPCTDDGCPDFHKEGDDNIVIPEPIEDIRGEIKLYHELVVPVIQTETKDEFVYSLNECIDYLYTNEVPFENRVPKELIIAQAAIETGWGKSRFANEGNNLFGIRTWDQDEPYLLPIPWTKWPGWGVKMYSSKCESVIDYLHILNNVSAFKELRAARDSGIDDALILADYHSKYASKPTYTELVKEIIKYNLRGVYEL